jgi:hypothetical protein
MWYNDKGDRKKKKQKREKELFLPVESNFTEELHHQTSLSCGYHSCVILRSSCIQVLTKRQAISSDVFSYYWYSLHWIILTELQISLYWYLLYKHFIVVYLISYIKWSTDMSEEHNTILDLRTEKRKRTYEYNNLELMHLP